MSENKPIEEYQNNEISLVDILVTLWNRRGKIVIWSIICAVIIIAVGGTKYLTQAKYRASALSFSLNFSGVDKGQYPNGSRFTTNDIIGSTILQEVYNSNNLKKYYEDFNAFQSDISVYRDDFKLVFLRSEYAAKLSNKKLTVEVRDKIEADFKRLKAGVLANARFKLVLSDKDKVVLPSMLSNKILRDTLKNWLNNAEKEKGINKYRISMVTDNIISAEEIKNLDYIVGLDLLRETIKTVKGDINKVNNLPGSKITTVDTDKGKTNLSDLNFRINFLETFQLDALSGAIRAYGVSKEGPLSKIYLQSKLYELKRNQKAVFAEKKMYGDTLNNYTASSGQDYQIAGKLSGNMSVNSSMPSVIPQFDGNFFDKLVSMAQEDANVKYRQELTNKELGAGLKNILLEKEINYYTSLFESFKKFSSSSSSITKKEYGVVQKAVQTQQLKILTSITQIIRDTHKFYQKINEYSLNSQSEFYRVDSFTAVSINSISMKKVILVMILILILAEAVIIAGVLLGNKITESKR